MNDNIDWVEISRVWLMIERNIEEEDELKRELCL